MRGILELGTWFPGKQSTMWEETLIPPVLYTNCRACVIRVDSPVGFCNL